MAGVRAAVLTATPPGCQRQLLDLLPRGRLLEQITNGARPHPSPPQGTPTHMSPELFVAGHVSKASDVYAVGGHARAALAARCTVHAFRASVVR